MFRALLNGGDLNGGYVLFSDGKKYAPKVLSALKTQVPQQAKERIGVYKKPCFQGKKKENTYRGNFSSYISNSKTFKSVSVSVIKSIPQKNNSKKLPGCKCNLLKFLRSDWRDEKSTLTLRSRWPAIDCFRVFGPKSGEKWVVASPGKWAEKWLKKRKCGQKWHSWAIFGRFFPFSPVRRKSIFRQFCPISGRRPESSL